MNKIITSPNIIIKPSKTPSWRPLQPTVGSWTTLAKDKKSFFKDEKVEDQFSKEELLKISDACRYTNMMGNPSLPDDPMKDATEIAGFRSPSLSPLSI